MPAATDASNRSYDIVVYGASGFTGQLVVEYLAGKYPVGSPVRWAVAGRDRARLDRVIDDKFKTGERPAVIVADCNDEEALAGLARSTRVVLTTVGPYARYGSKLVAACVANGTHYCDLAGEAQWIRRMIDEHQAAAISSGARIVHSCGFDSIPSDMGVFFLQQEANSTFGSPCNDVVLLVKAMKGGASGGTFASMLNAIEEARNDRNVARVLRDPYALNPEGERRGPDRGDQHGIAWFEEAGVWTAPFVMASINTRIVRRTNALLDFRYGRDFRYREATATGGGIAGCCKAAVMTASLAAFMFACGSDFLRANVVRRLVPAPSEGPSREQRESGFFDMRLFGMTATGDRLRVRVRGDRDPGYGSTSKMLSESAMCLAFDEQVGGGGFFTPASAMAKPLLARLTSRAGLEFERLN